MLTELGRVRARAITSNWGPGVYVCTLLDVDDADVADTSIRGPEPETRRSLTHFLPKPSLLPNA